MVCGLFSGIMEYKIVPASEIHWAGLWDLWQIKLSDLVLSSTMRSESLL